ncbi:DNA polymerase IV [Kordiimonas sediminis]|uniref:DNA polymerase IV n=2 Tax=Kordiimonas sediminis TaxID=1735581 RepID=A0A919EAX6_9PROT|nr:DNA polymerase IV [Kordiimonas sediminis]
MHDPSTHKDNEQMEKLSPAVCRECFHSFTGTGKCPKCRRPRTICHPELFDLGIAHIDCDSFYASIEKRDNPALRDKPVIIGHGKRGVVSTACYLARMSGVRSAMPIYKARALCPDAVFIPPRMAKYAEVGRDIRAMMQDMTPLVEPLSIDEAFLDMTGTERLHGAPPAVTLARFAETIQEEIGVSVSIGLSHNKFLAKLASDMNKPRGFTVIGKAETTNLLAGLPISRIYGVGTKMARTLEKDGLTEISQLQTMDQRQLVNRYGETGLRLFRLARGIDTRPVTASNETKSVSAERTLEKDIADYPGLEKLLYSSSERVSADLKKKELAGVTITLKMKNRYHKIITRSRTLDAPTQLAHVIFETGQSLLRPLVDGTPYRLLGIGVSNFRPLSEADMPDLIEPIRSKRTQAEKAMDALKERFGAQAIGKGRSLH